MQSLKEKRENVHNMIPICKTQAQHRNTRKHESTGGKDSIYAPKC
jgi:hypothetical protein